MNKFELRLIAVVIFGLALTACASKPPAEPVEEPPVQAAVEPEPAPIVEEAPPVEEVAVVSEPPPIIEVKPPENTELFFAYDSAEISAAGDSTLADHAEFLGSNPDKIVVITGHADERGTDEYNDNLGMKRANAIRSGLIEKGVNASQLRFLSFGEKQPKSQGTGEEIWQTNRRGEIIYNPSDDLVSQAQGESAPGSEMFVSDN